MQKIKRLAAMLAGALMFVMAAGCGETGEEQDGGGGQAPAHTHTFAVQWSQDPQYHWHAATCMHAEEVSDKAAHVFEDGKCSVCGYRKTDEDIDPFAIVSDKLTEAEWKAGKAHYMKKNARSPCCFGRMPYGGGQQRENCQEKF